MRMTLLFGNTNVSKLFNKMEYSVSYERRAGAGEGTAKDGSTIFDTLAYKAIIELQTNGMSAEDMAALIAMLQSDCLLVTYDDPKTNDTRCSSFHPEFGTAKIWAYNIDGIGRWFDKTTVKLTEV